MLEFNTYFYAVVDLIFFIAQFLLLGLNIFGFSIEFDKLFTITWLGILFLVGAMTIGIILGLIAGNTGSICINSLCNSNLR